MKWRYIEDFLLAWILIMGLVIMASHAANLGTWEIDDNLTFSATVHDATGIAQAADSNVYWRVYEDETGTALLNGTMTRIDASNFPGLYTEQIALTAANGFEKGKAYTVGMKAGVDSVTGEASHNFQIHAFSDYKATGFSTFNASTDEVDIGEVKGSAVTGVADFRATGFSTFNAGSDTVTVGTNNDKTGYSLSASGVTAVQSGLALASALSTLQSTVDALENLSAAEVLTQIQTYDGPTKSELDTAVATMRTYIQSASEEAAARTWAVSGRELSTPNNYKATGFSTPANINSATAYLANQIAAASAEADDAILSVSDEFGSGGGGGDATLENQNIIKSALSRLASVSPEIELNSGVYRFTTEAVANVSVGDVSGVADWTASEKQQMRAAIGINGASTTQPTSDGIMSRIWTYLRSR